jgi:hypothetical protein
LRRYGFGSTTATGSLVFAGTTHTLSPTEKQNLLQRLYEYGTHRGDTFDNAEHTAASGIDCSTYARLITASFTLTDGVLTVTV